MEYKFSKAGKCCFKLEIFNTYWLSLCITDADVLGWSFGSVLTLLIFKMIGINLLVKFKAGVEFERVKTGRFVSTAFGFVIVSFLEYGVRALNVFLSLLTTVDFVGTLLVGVVVGLGVVGWFVVVGLAPITSENTFWILKTEPFKMIWLIA